MSSLNRRKLIEYFLKTEFKHKQMLDRLQDERTGKPLETSENLTEILALNNQMSEHYAKAQQARIMLIKIQNGDFDEFD